MPYKSITARRKVKAKSERNRRRYLAAAAAGDPKALEAERLREAARNPMRPLNDLEAKLAKMSKAEREPYRAEHAALRARCLAIDTEEAEAEYKRLRAEVLAEIEIFS